MNIDVNTRPFPNPAIGLIIGDTTVVIGIDMQCFLFGIAWQDGFSARLGPFTLHIFALQGGGDGD